MDNNDKLTVNIGVRARRRTNKRAAAKPCSWLASAALHCRARAGKTPHSKHDAHTLRRKADVGDHSPPKG